MAGRKNTTPLFEVLGQGAARQSRSVEPTPPAPSGHGVPASETVEAARSPLGDGQVRLHSGMVEMPLAYFAVIVTIALAAVVLAWTVAYRRGERAAREEIALINSALGEPANARPSEVGDLGGGVLSRGTNSGGGQIVGAAIRRAGVGGSDPRRARHNYLRLASRLTRAQADSAVAFLGGAGLEAFAVVDPKALRGKDEAVFILYGMEAMASGQADSPEARAYVDQAKKVGKSWRAAGGQWDFRDAMWELFKGG